MESNTNNNKLIYFQCFKIGGRLRIKIISDGYNKEANCQFPRAIRKEGQKYSASRDCLSFSSGRSGKFFYRVKKVGIKIIEDEPIKVQNVYDTCESGECIVCMDNSHTLVIAPCGHYCLCDNCGGILINSTKTCPMCRGEIKQLIPKDKIEIA